MTERPGQSDFLDRAALLLSGLCLLHCLLLPVVVAMLPFLGQFGDDHLHLEMLVVVVPVSVLALVFGYRRHRHGSVVMAGLIGLLLLAFGGTVAHDVYGIVADRIFTVVGSVVLGFTHYRNFRLSRCSVHSPRQ